jgi:pyruvate formate-lyase activating enzyme-like uncharacterized protein
LPVGSTAVKKAGVGGGKKILGLPWKGMIASRGQLYMARGCDLCFPGLKAVIFVTGLCDDSCFYCPVSRAKLGRDVFYVNEVEVGSVEEAVAEVARIGAEGASFTGGDPLIALERVTRLAAALKSHFGPSFHIHLYTSGRRATPAALKAIWESGVDEIRFHPTHPSLFDRISIAKAHTGMSVGAEIPIAPGMEDWAKKVIIEVERRGGDFVNLNEMEIVEPNARALLARGLRESRSRPFTVEGSLEAALNVLEWASENAGIPVHFCPASFKDRIQTGNRLRNTARRDAYWYEEPSTEGTVIWGELRGGNPPPGLGYKCGPRTICLPPRPDILLELARRYGGEAYIVEAHPTPERRPIVREERIA